MADQIHMMQEIQEQPQVLSKIWETRQDVARLAARIPKAALTIFTAFGSSYHASLYGQFLFSHVLGTPSFVATPSFFLEQKKGFRIKDSLVIAISQSGKVEEVVEAVKFLKKKGSRTLAVTNDASSKLALICHEVLPLQAGVEKSIPATKTFTAALYNLQLLTAYIGSKALLKDISKVPDLAASILKDGKRMQDLARKLEHKSRILILAPESLKSVAQEGGLKLKECAYVMAESFEWREFFHGPVALMEKEIPAIVLEDPGNPAKSRHLELMLRKIGNYAYPLGLKGFKEIKAVFSAAIPYTILLQMLALNLAIEKNINPDHPRYLKKVVKVSV